MYKVYPTSRQVISDTRPSPAFLSLVCSLILRNTHGAGRPGNEANMGIHRYTQVYTGIHRYTLVYMGVYTGIHRYTWVYTLVYTGIHGCIHWYTLV